MIVDGAIEVSGAHRVRSSAASAPPGDLALPLPWLVALASGGVLLFGGQAVNGANVLLDRSPPVPRGAVIVNGSPPMGSSSSHRVGLVSWKDRSRQIWLDAQSVSHCTEHSRPGETCTVVTRAGALGTEYALGTSRRRRLP